MLTLKKYNGKEGIGNFEPMSFDTARQLQYGQHVWFLAIQGDARRAKVNGSPKTWKRSPQRLEVSLKYGMYEFAKFDETDIANGRLLVECAS